MRSEPTNSTGRLHIDSGCAGFFKVLLFKNLNDHSERGSETASRLLERGLCALLLVQKLGRALHDLIRHALGEGAEWFCNAANGHRFKKRLPLPQEAVVRLLRYLSRSTGDYTELACWAPAR